MKLVNKHVAVAMFFSSVLSISVGNADSVPPPATAAMISPPQEAVEAAVKARGKTGGIVLSTKADGVQLSTGWYKVQQSYHFLGDTGTWAYLEGPNSWIYCSDDTCEHMLMAAAGSYHWLYVNMTSASSFNAVRLWKN